MLFAASLFAQNVDSLLDLTKTLDDSKQKVDLINKLVRINFSSNFQNVEQLARTALELSNSINYEKGKCVASKWLGDYFEKQRKYDSAKIFYDQALNIAKKSNLNKQVYDAYYSLSYLSRKKSDGKEKIYLDSALNFAESNNYKTGIAKSYQRIASYYSRNGEEDSSKIYFDRSINTFDQLNDQIGLASALNNLAIFLARTSKLDSAEHFFLKSTEIRENLEIDANILEEKEITELDLQNALADNYNNLALVNYFRSRYDSFVKYSLNALDIYEKTNNQKGMADIYLNIANVQINNLEQFEKAINNLKNAVEINKKEQNDESLSNNYILLGNCFRSLDSLDKALEYYSNALDIAENINLDRDNSNQIAKIYMNLGLVYKSQNKLNKAKIYYKKALYLYELDKNKNEASLSVIYNNLADLFKDTGEFSKSIKYLELSKEIAKKRSDIDVLLSSYDNLSQVYDSLSNWKKAFQNLKKYQKLNDSINSEELKKSMAEIEEKYQSEKKEQEIENLKEQSNLRDERDLIYNIATVIGILSALIIIIITYNRYRIKKKSNILLEQQKLEISKQKSLVDEKNEEILSSIRYAERLQNAILPIDDEISKSFKDHSLIYRPKDIVSGDFYWFANYNEHIYLAVVDCTGHGIPGAMLSLVGNMFLAEAVGSAGLMEPDLILEYLDRQVTGFLRQETGNVKTQDGMDACLIKINREKDKILFSGAKRPLYICDEKGSFSSIRGTSKSIGGTRRKQNKNYELIEIEYKENMNLYLFSDGLVDQIGSDGKKFGSKKLKNYIKKYYDFPMKEQGVMLDYDLKAHQGNEDQRDDITFIGVKL